MTYHVWTKHIKIYYHFIHERVASNKASLIYIALKDNVADIMTKAIPPDNHTKLKELLGITRDLTRWGGVLEAQLTHICKHHVIQKSHGVHT